MEAIEKFYAYLEELLQNYTNLAALLRQKLAAVERFDINSLDSIMKDEQVHVLLAKNFESRIATYKKDLGLTGDTLSVIIPQLPDNEQPRFDAIFAKLKEKLAEVKDANLTCQTRIEEKLVVIEKNLHKLDKTETHTYGKAAAEVKDSGSKFLNKDA